MNKKPVIADVTQTFYNKLATQYDKFYPDWDAAVEQEAEFLQALFREHGFDPEARILDCACGIGTQAIGLAALGYSVTGSDASAGALAEAEKRSAERGVDIRFIQADFRALQESFPEQFDIVIAMDNALPHMLTRQDLAQAIGSIVDRIRPGGLFVASIRDYDRILEERPAFSAPYVHKTAKGRRILFQTWDWIGENYRFIQYIIDDEDGPQVSKFECEYRATRRTELTQLLLARGCRAVEWKLPEQTGFYQPIVTAEK